MELRTSRVYCVGGGEADIFGNCRPGVLQNFMQDVATRHASGLGMSRDDLPGNNVWVLTRIKYTLSRPLPYLSTVEVATWHRGNVGAHFYRDFEIFLNGEPVGDAISAWVVLDLESGRIMRPHELGASGTEYSPPVPKTELLPRIRRPDGLTPAGTRTAAYSDADINGHVNNVRYCDFACDALWLHERGNCFVRSVWIQYTGQTRPGETMSLLTGCAPGGKLFVAGDGADGKPRFDAILDIEAAPN